MVGGRSGELRRQLEQEIITGELTPGARLDERSLAERFNVSRTPVREALRFLASIGLVEIRPNRGAVVASIGIRDLIEMFEVMAQLEGLCGRFAARRMSRGERDRLRQIHEAGEAYLAKADADGYYANNVEFHEAIYRGSHNRFLADQTMALRNRLSPYRRVQLRSPGRLAESHAEHGAILDALVDRDGERAERLLGAHVAVQSDSFNDFLAQLPPSLLAQTA